MTENRCRFPTRAELCFYRHRLLVIIESKLGRKPNINWYFQGKTDPLPNEDEDPGKHKRRCFALVQRFNKHFERVAKAYDVGFHTDPKIGLLVPIPGQLPLWADSTPPEPPSTLPDAMYNCPIWDASMQWNPLTPVGAVDDFELVGDLGADIDNDDPKDDGGDLDNFAADEDSVVEEESCELEVVDEVDDVLPIHHPNDKMIPVVVDNDLQYDGGDLDNFAADEDSVVVDESCELEVVDEVDDVLPIHHPNDKMILVAKDAALVAKDMENYRLRQELKDVHLAKKLVEEEVRKKKKSLVAQDAALVAKDMENYRLRQELNDVHLAKKLVEEEVRKKKKSLVAQDAALVAKDMENYRLRQELKGMHLGKNWVEEEIRKKKNAAMAAMAKQLAEKAAKWNDDQQGV